VVSSLSRRDLLAALVATGCGQPSRGPRAALRANLPYRSASSHPKHHLDAYLPGGTGHPMVVFFHGGYWVSGDRRAPEHGSGLYTNVGEALARRGVVTLVPSYRLSPEVTVGAMLEDALEAVRWGQRHAASLGVDARRTFLVGHSAGGHLAAQLATGSDLSVAGVGVLSGIWDVADMRAKQSVGFNRAVTSPVFGDGDDALWSPLQRLQRGPEHWLVLTAEDDFDYLPPQAEQAHRRLGQLGRQSRRVIVAGYDHLDVVRRFGASGDGVVDAVAGLAHADVAALGS
jgi:acetyl esterase/lipase